MDTVARGLSSQLLMRFIDLSTDSLAEHRAEIDALNVFPVPDGDTGTNMYLTVSAARESAHEVLAALPDTTDPESLEVLGRVLAAIARGALLGARGNSGVILSQLLGALAERLAESAAADEAQFTTKSGAGRAVAAAMHASAEAAYAAVGTPVEGTILTVARAAALAATTRSEGERVSVGAVFAAAAEAAHEALARTPDLLPVLKDAGVVDAGGQGLCVILDAAERAATGRRPAERAHRKPGAGRSPAPERVPGADLDPDGPAYEVMYLLDAPATGIGELRTSLAALGDSLVVVGGDGLWNVHVHVDDVGAAIEAGIAAGRPHRIRVTHFADQLAHEHGRQESGPDTTGPRHQRAAARSGRAVVAVAAGDGLAQLFSEAGAHVVRGGPGERPSAGALLAAVDASRAADVVLLPNDNDSIRVAQIAASTAEADLGIRAQVIPTQAQVEGLAALAVHDPDRAFEADVLEMRATAAHVRQGAVTVAAKKAITMAGPCEPGDVLGVVAGDFAVVGQDLAEVTRDVLARLLGGGGELVTLVSGSQAPEGVAEDTVAWLEEHFPHVDVDLLDGGQDRYPFLMSVE